MKRTLLLLLLPLLLTSCSNPDTSGGVTLSRDGNEFPYGSCEGQGKKELSDKRTGCGWIHVNEESHYIMPSAHLRSANLRGADLTRADLRDADLSGADLTRADLRGADLSDADLRGAFLGGEWASVLLSCSVLVGDIRCTNLRRADLRGVDLSYTDLRGADLSDADLRDADLSGADLTHADLRGAKRSGVKADSRTTCPNYEKWGTRRHDCGF